MNSDTPSFKQSILVVDDDQTTLTLVGRVLTDAGYKVVTVLSGFEAVDKLRRQPYDFQLVLLDLTMPFMDGEETFQRLREIRPDLPVILETGFIHQEKLQELFTVGLAGFLRKPVAPNEIVATVRSTLESVKYNGGGVNPGRSISL